MTKPGETTYQRLRASLPAAPKTWLVTGVAGFIGSNLLETLLKLDQRVVGLDNFSTGHRRNLDEVRALVGPPQWARFRFIEGDIREPDTCRRAAEGVDFALHQAALGSVPRSLADPIATNASNVTSFLNMLVAARDAGVFDIVGEIVGFLASGDPHDADGVADHIGGAALAFRSGWHSLPQDLLSGASALQPSAILTQPRN